MNNERGFTLIEVLSVTVMLAVLLALGAAALRGYWLTRSLEGAQAEIATQLRQLQEQAVSDSHPFVYGARFKVDSGEWSLVQFDPKGTGTADDLCQELRTQTFSGGVTVTAASFSPDPSNATATCQSAPPNGVGPTADPFVFFFARGTAVPGTVTVARSGKPPRSVVVKAITGRVTEQP